MRLILAVIMSLLWSSLSFAEHQDFNTETEQNLQNFAVRRVNKIAELVRDPTRIKGRFNEVLQNFRPADNVTADNGRYEGPVITLNALVTGANQQYSAMIKIDKSVHLIKIGSTLSVLTKKDQMYEVLVDDITRDEVRLTLQPTNKKLILR